jgi:hypothetical protein
MTGLKEQTNAWNKVYLGSEYDVNYNFSSNSIIFWRIQSLGRYGVAEKVPACFLEEKEGESWEVGEKKVGRPWLSFSSR